MILDKISIINYRNIKAASLRMSPKINCFIGNNGEGKTNMLDAIYYLSFCRSAFNPIDSQVILHDAPFMTLEGRYRLDAGAEEVDVYCGMKRGQKKHVKRDRKEYKRLSQHIGLVPLVFIAPSDMVLIDGGSEDRRKLMDVVIAQYDNTYMDLLNSYNKALQQRNVLLKQETAPDLALMELWEEQMAETGTQIHQKRATLIDQLTPVFQNVHGLISNGREAVSLRYVSHGQRGSLLETIQRDRMKDMTVGYSLHGIHRDDLEMLQDGYPVRREGSQGQSKTFVLALKLAQFEFLRRTSPDNVPLLLLDDIFDKLDASRVEQIVHLVSGSGFGQIFITDTNRDHLDHILRHTSQDYALFNVNEGVFAPEQSI